MLFAARADAGVPLRYGSRHPTVWRRRRARGSGRRRPRRSARMEPHLTTAKGAGQDVPAVAALRCPDAVDDVLAGDLVATLATVTPARGVVLTPMASIGLRDRERGTFTFTT